MRTIEETQQQIVSNMVKLALIDMHHEVSTLVIKNISKKPRDVDFKTDYIINKYETKIKEIWIAKSNL